MAVKKEFLSTKSDKEKVYTALNLSVLIPSETTYDESIAVAYKNCYASIDNAIISYFLGNSNINISGNDNLLIVNTAFKERLGKTESIEEFYEILRENHSFCISKDEIINKIKRKEELLVNQRNDKIFELNLTSDNISYLSQIMEDNKDSFHAYPYLEIDHTNTTKICFQLNNYKFDKEIDIFNLNKKFFTVYFPYEICKHLKKIKSINYKVFSLDYHKKANSAELNFNFNGFDIKCVYAVMKERND